MKTRSGGTRVWLIIVAVLVVAGVAAYFVGGAVERGGRARDAAAAQTRYTAMQAQINALQSADHLLGANMWISRATVALDNRNFGVANVAVAKAVKNLKVVDAAALGLDSKKLMSLQNEAGAISISVATNLESERNQLLHLAEGIDVLAEQAAKNVSPKPVP